MPQDVLINRYRKCAAEGVKLMDLDATALAGYYFANYSGDPLGALLLDVKELVIPTTLGQSAKVVIVAVLSRERFINYELEEKMLCSTEETKL